jgi:putative transposase
MNQPMQNRPVRKHIRIKGFSYTTPGSYFVTICCLERRGLFEAEPARRIAQECWDDVPNHYPNVEIDEFVVMPNHVHGILVLTEVARSRQASPLPPIASLGTVIGGYKSAVTRRLHDMGLSPDAVWQRGYYERVIRGEGELLSTRQYIRDNPLRWSEDPYFVP